MKKSIAKVLYVLLQLCHLVPTFGSSLFRDAWKVENMHLANTTINKIVGYLMEGNTPDEVKAKCTKTLQIGTKNIGPAMKEAKQRLLDTADISQAEMKGAAITRIQKIIADSEEDDPRTALQAQKELNKLLSLYPEKGIDLGTDDDEADESELEKRLSVIEGYIYPLELTDPSYPIEEHIRIAAQIVQQNHLKGE